MSQVELPISGMTCANCARAVERAVKKLPGVASVNVNLASERAAVEYTPGAVSIAHIVAAIRKAGYDVPAQPADLGSRAALDATRAARQAELAQRRRRAIVGLLLALPTFTLSMGRDLGLLGLVLGPAFAPPGGHAAHQASEQAVLNWLLFALALPVQLYVGWPFYTHGYTALRNGAPNMDVLVALGSSAAFGYSCAVLLGWVDGHVYFETAAVILALISLGKYLEARAKGQAGAAIERLLDLTPKTARRLRPRADGSLEEEDVPVASINIGDLLVARPGERIAADGVVVAGHSAVDESMITGESVPRDKGPGDTVIAGTVNREGVLRYEAARVGQDTVLAQIVRLVAQAQGSKAPIQALADRVSAVFVPAVMLIAIGTFAAWLALGGDFQRAMINAVAVLVVACPCALGLATPAAIMVGMGRGAELGILFRNSAALEQAARVGLIAFDKTGTLTQGRPTVVEVVVLDQTCAPTPDALLALAAGAEQHSEHPLAQAIVEAAKARAIQPTPTAQFRALPGMGVFAVAHSTGDNQRTIAVGSARLMAQQGVALDERAEAQIARLQARGCTVMLVAVDGRLAGAIGLRDTARPESRTAIAALKQRGIRTLMLTGDNAPAARAVAEELGIDEVLADVMPGEKAARIAALKLAAAAPRRRSARALVAMVGDGINDAPALAEADVGIAVGSGTDVAIEAADVTLMRSDLRQVVQAIDLARATARGIRQNLFWAFFYNLLLIPLAALGVFQQYGPVLAAGAMASSSLFVVGNSLRLRRQVRGGELNLSAQQKAGAHQIRDDAPSTALG
jgi:Cu+-exporting ATPase